MGNPFGNGMGAPAGAAAPRNLVAGAQPGGGGSKPTQIVGPGAPVLGRGTGEDPDPASIPQGGPLPFDNEHVTPGQSATDPLGGVKVPEKPFKLEG